MSDGPFSIEVRGGTADDYIRKIKRANCPSEVIVKGTGRLNVNTATRLSAILQRAGGADVLNGTEYVPLEITTTWKYKPIEHGEVRIHFERVVGS